MRIVCFIFFIVCISTGIAVSEPPVDHDLTVKAHNGTINWTKGVFTAIGVGVPPDDYHNNPQGKTLALRMAAENAQRNLLSVVAQIQIDADTTMKSLLKENAVALSQIKEMVKEADVVSQEYSTDGSVTVMMQMHISGGFAQLVLPPKIKQIESIKPVGSSSDISKIANNSDFANGNTQKEEPLTGLIVDARELSFTPCLVPRIVDEFGREVFGPAFASREFAVQRGMSGYSVSLTAASTHPRVAPRPLIVKGLKAEGEARTGIVISNTDAAKLKHAFENIVFLRRCCVMIVADSMENGSGLNPHKHSKE